MQDPNTGEFHPVSEEEVKKLTEALGEPVPYTPHDFGDTQSSPPGTLYVGQKVTFNGCYFRIESIGKTRVVLKGIAHTRFVPRKGKQ